MEMVFDSWSQIPLTENHVRQLHKVLLQYSEKDERHRGSYKTHPNDVEAFDADGRSLGVVFQTAEPFDTPYAMQALVEWTAGALEARTYHPLLVIAAFLVRFLAIHPFQDGNGRLSRILTTLLLLRSGYAYVPYSSMERVIEDNKSQYSRCLRSTQGTLDRDESRLIDGISFFLRCMVQQKDRLERQLDADRVLESIPLPPLSAQLLELARRRGNLTLSAAVASTGANRNTVKLHLRNLTRAGFLSLRGTGRGAWYEPAR